MKKIISALLIVVLVVIGCKQSGSSKVEDGMNTVTESSEIDQENQKNSTEVDSLKRMTLNELIRAYIQYKDSASFANTFLSEIVTRHEISDSLYNKFHENFWKLETSYVLPILKNDLEEMLKSANDSAYVQFTFGPKKVANDFNYNVVKDHTFNSFVSCFPVTLLKEIIGRSDYKSLAITKGIKHLTKSPTCKYEGDFYIAMLIYKDKKNNIKYYDIVEDPGH